MKLTINQLDTLHRVALAAFYTSPTTRDHISKERYDVGAALQQLHELGLIRHDGRWLMTAAGDAALNAQLDSANAVQLANLRARRARRTTASGR